MSKEIPMEDIINTLLKRRSDEKEVIHAEIDKLVEVANSLMKFFLDDNQGYAKYENVLQYDEDVIEYLNRYESKEKKKIIINESIRQYHVNKESRGE
jgi:hypothetical protein